MEYEKNIAPYYSTLFEAPKARVLIVDEDDLSQIIIVKLLQETKILIDTASSAEECLKKTSTRYYNVILMHDTELIKDVRNQEKGLCKETDIVLLMEGVQSDEILKYQQKGFAGVLQKPIDVFQLEQEVLKHIPKELIEYQRKSRRRKKIHITSDGVCDLTPELLEKYDIKLIDLYIKTEAGRFRDTEEIDIHNLSRYLSEENTTAYSLSPTVEDYERFFAETLLEADQVIYISMAGGAGHSFEYASKAAEKFTDVYVVDSAHISCGQGLVVLHAAKLVSEGASVKEVLQEIEKMKWKVKAAYLLPSTRIFYQKGFTDKITARICDVFRMHPILGSFGNKITVLGVRIGKLESVWKKFIRFHLRNATRIDDRVIFVVHAGCTVRQQEIILEEVNRNMRFKQVIFTQASSASVCNAGLGSIGFAIYYK